MYVCMYIYIYIYNTIQKKKKNTIALLLLRYSYLLYLPPLLPPLLFPSSVPHTHTLHLISPDKIIAAFAKILCCNIPDEARGGSQAVLLPFPFNYYVTTSRHCHYDVTIPH